MIRRILAKCWLLFAVVTILLAVGMTVARLLLPIVSDYRVELERWFTKSVGQPVQIGRLEAEWHGFGPRLNIYDVIVYDDQFDRQLVRFKRASFGLDLLASLFNGQVEFGNLTVIGTNLSLLRQSDGSITVQGFSLKQNQDVPARKNDRVLQWLFSQENIAIEAAEVIWKDLADGNNYQFSNVNLDMRNEGSRHQLDGSAALPASMGHRISFAIDLQGDLLVAGDWGGRGYINGGGLQLDRLLIGHEMAGIHVDHGVAEVRLWSEWKNARLVKLEGILSSFGMELSPVNLLEADNNDETQNDIKGVPDSYKADTLSGRFAWQRQENGWAIAVNNFVLGRGGRHSPLSDLSFKVSELGQTPRIEAKTTYLHISDIRDLLLVSNLPGPKLRKALVAIQPRGDLYDTYLDFQGGDESREKINIVSRFKGLAIEQWGKLPAIEGLSGIVKGNDSNGSIEFTSSSAQVTLEPMFREPIAISELGGVVTWQYRQGNIQLSSDELLLNNDDLQIHASMDVIIPDDGKAPFLSLDANFSGTPGSVAHTSHYLPVTLMPHTTKWLDRSIIGGTISAGTFIFDGRVDQFPFNHDEGKFEVRFNLTDGILDYAQGWPRLEAIDAEVRFVGSSMEINAISGKSFNSEVTQVQARIANLRNKPALLEIQGKAQGPTRDALRYIAGTPLADRFGQYINDITATGNSHLDIRLIRPLAKDETTRVDGTLTFEDSGLLLAASRVDMTNINGELKFTESTLAANNIKGKLLGLESVIDVKTQQEQQISATYITANGEADEESIARLLQIPVMKNLKGKSRWTARLRIPKAAGSEATVSNLHIESDLHGLAINLPEPLKKDADDTRKLVIETGLPRSLDKLIEVRLDDILSANLDVDNQMHIERGEIHVGKGMAPYPEREGLHISGKWPELSLDEWLPLINSKELPATSPSPSTAVINDIAVDIENVEAFARHYHKVKLEAKRAPDMWQITVNSDEMKGIIQLPFDPDAMLIMDLDYLHLAKLENKQAGDQIDPRKLPIVRIDSKSFSYDNIEFGSLKLTASRHPAGIHLDNLKLASPSFNVDARGDWVRVNGDHFSSFNISFNSQDLGKTLANWGYVGNIKNGKSTFDIVARWPGPPTSFALERLDGNLHLKITDGRLLDIEPGAGRIFGLISLQALPRRLSLDFSDIFQKGFTFDRIEGDFVLNDGNATTENLTMDGPAARIEAQGRIGLAARDYDQTVTLNPNVSSSLPVAGAVVGGMGVGAAILLAQKLLEPEIDKATRIKYSITGSWDNPDIKRIDERKPDVNDAKGQNK